MTAAYQLETKIKGGWQFTTIISAQTGVYFELSYKHPESPTWGLKFSPVHYVIHLGSPNENNYSLNGTVALKGWLELRNFDPFQPGLAQFVTDWGRRAKAVLLLETTQKNGAYHRLVGRIIETFQPSPNGRQ